MKKVPVKPLLPWWDLAPKTPVLSRDEVHVWCAENEQGPSAFVSTDIPHTYPLDFKNKEPHKEAPITAIPGGDTVSN